MIKVYTKTDALALITTEEMDSRAREIESLHNALGHPNDQVMQDIIN